MYDNGEIAGINKDGKVYLQTWREWEIDKPATATISILLAVPFQQDGIDKYFVLTEAQPQYASHADFPIIDGAVFSRIENGWRVEIQHQRVAFIGTFGRAPKGELVRIGPDRYGVLLRHFDVQTNDWLERYYIITNNKTSLDVIFFFHNTRPCDINASTDCKYSPSDITFIHRENSIHYDIQVTGNLRHSDGEFCAMQTYVFSGEKYVLAAEIE